MQIEISESTVNQIVERLKSQGLPDISGPEVVVRILNLFARSAAGLTFNEIKDELREHPEENARQMADRLGLIGAFASGHTDLSTNPVHMIDFGQ